MSQQHLVLVPGFAGFEILAPLEYFEDVADALRPLLVKTDPRPTLHLLEHLPASVTERARAIGRWMARQLDHGAFHPGDDVHLVGHSTGGLAIRRLLFDLASQPRARLDETLPHRGRDLLELIRSVQFISTPHQGTNLARWAAELQSVPQVAVLAGLMVLGGLAPLVAASGVSTAPKDDDKSRDLLDALLDDRARSKGAFYGLLKWLHEMTDAKGAVTDLIPRAEDDSALATGSPVHFDDETRRLELEAIESLRLRSIVTRAAPRDDEPWNLFSVLDLVMCYDLPDALGNLVKVPRLRAPEMLRTVDASDHDGIVNSTSMIWPDAEHSVLLEADHGDVIGHFDRGRNNHGYDLLPSAAAFDRASFEETWQDIWRFAIEGGEP